MGGYIKRSTRHGGTGKEYMKNGDYLKPAQMHGKRQHEFNHRSTMVFVFVYPTTTINYVLGCNCYPAPFRRAIHG